MKKMLGGLFLLLSLTSFAQEVKPDIILKTNEEEMKGKILEISDTEVKFTYTGETTIYKLKKFKIAKITHSSSSSSTTLNLNIYNDKGASVYSQERKSLFTTSLDAYIATLEYLLKRTPLYSK